MAAATADRFSAPPHLSNPSRTFINNIVVINIIPGARNITAHACIGPLCITPRTRQIIYDAFRAAAAMLLLYALTLLLMYSVARRPYSNNARVTAGVPGT